jgi:hypothetical protein
MANDLIIKLHHASLPFDLKGRMTKPAVGIQDQAFVYVPSIKTNLAETFRKARETLRGARIVEAVEVSA